MPWECQTCRIEVKLDSESCPKCGTPKTHWTIVQDKTRNLVISRKKFMLMRGTGLEPQPRSERGLGEIVKADRIQALPKSLVRDLADRGQRPAPGHVLVVRLHPRQERDLTIQLEVQARAGSRSHAYAGERAQSMPFDANFLTASTSKPATPFDTQFVFVYGDGSIEGVAFQDLELVDVSDTSGADGWAPTVEFKSLQQKAQSRPVVGIPQTDWIDLEVVREDGRSSVGLAYWVETPDGTRHTGVVGPEGVVRIEGFQPGECKVRFEEPPPKKTGWIDLEVMRADGRSSAGLAYLLKAPDGKLYGGTVGPEGIVRVEGFAPGECQVWFLGSASPPRALATDWIELDVMRADGKPAANVPFKGRAPERRPKDPVGEPSAERTPPGRKKQRRRKRKKKRARWGKKKKTGKAKAKKKKKTGKAKAKKKKKKKKSGKLKAKKRKKRKTIGKPRAKKKAGKPKAKKKTGEPKKPGKPKIEPSGGKPKRPRS